MNDYEPFEPNWMSAEIHEKDNPDCPQCWHETPLQCVCGGLIHTAFGDYLSYDSYYLEKQCDSCDDWQEKEREE